MAGLKKGHNFAIQGPTEKKIPVHLFFVLMIHIKIQVPSSSGSLVFNQQYCYIGRVEKRHNLVDIHKIRSNVNHVIYTLVLSHMPNIKILAQAVLKILC